MTFDNEILKNALETVWMFIGNRGAKEVRYEKAVERRVDLAYLGHPEEGLDETRMLRTTGDWANSSWEVEQGGFLFEIEGGVVTCATIGPERAREELYKMLLSTMAVCGAPSEVRKS